jgi:membrane-associated phospholipid phosphatase
VTAPSFSRRVFPRGLLDFAWQAFVVIAAYMFWRLARGAAEGGAAASLAHARDLVSVERSLHSFVELDVQNWAVNTGWAADFASWMYGHAHFYGTLGALLFVYFAHNRSFCFVRNALLAAMAISLLGYFLFPTAPPRFVPGLGFSSAHAVTGNDAIQVSHGAFFNPYAAVPSMHVGMSLILGLSLARLSRQRALKALFVAYPAVMTFAVVATGNHFWLDGAAGAVVAAAAFGAAALLARVRPELWSFRARETTPPHPVAPEAEVATA